MKYRKRQKLSERKVLRFTGFHPNVGKAFAVFASSVLKVPIGQSISREIFHNLLTIHENHEAFLSRSFFVYGSSVDSFEKLLSLDTR